MAPRMTEVLVVLPSVAKYLCVTVNTDFTSACFSLWATHTLIKLRYCNMNVNVRAISYLCSCQIWIQMERGGASWILSSLTYMHLKWRGLSRMDRPLLGSPCKFYCLLRVDKMVAYRVLLLCLSFRYWNYYLKIISMIGANFVPDVRQEFIMIYTDLYLCDTNTTWYLVRSERRDVCGGSVRCQRPEEASIWGLQCENCWCPFLT